MIIEKRYKFIFWIISQSAKDITKVPIAYKVTIRIIRVDNCPSLRTLRQLSLFIVYNREGLALFYIADELSRSSPWVSSSYIQTPLLPFYFRHFGQQTTLFEGKTLFWPCSSPVAALFTHNTAANSCKTFPPSSVDRRAPTRGQTKKAPIINKSHTPISAAGSGYDGRDSEAAHYSSARLFIIMS